MGFQNEEGRMKPRQLAIAKILILILCVCASAATAAASGWISVPKTLSTAQYNDLGCIWGSGATDVYAFGGCGTSAYYNGMAWVVEGGQCGIFSHGSVNGIWGSADNDVFVVGGWGGGIPYPVSWVNWTLQRFSVDSAGQHPGVARRHLGQRDQ